MADFYKVLRKTVEALPVATGQARRAVYDRARKALGNQLEAVDPPLAPSEISRQRLALEDSIRAVEDDYLSGEIVTTAEQEDAVRKAQMEEEEAAFRAARTSRIINEKADQIREIESGGVPDQDDLGVAFDSPNARSRQPRREAPQPRSAPPPEAEPLRRVQEPDYFEAPQPRRPHADYDDRYEAEEFDRDSDGRRGRSPDPREYADVPPMDNRRAPRRDAPPPQRGLEDIDDEFGVEDRFLDASPDERAYRDAHAPRRSEFESEFDPTDEFAPAPRGGRYRDDRRGELHRGADYGDRYGSEPRRRRIWPWILLLIVLLAIGGGGYFAWQNQDNLLKMAEDLLNYGESDVSPLQPTVGNTETTEGPRRINTEGGNRLPETPPEETNVNKDEGRLVDDSGQMNPDAADGGATGSVVGENALPHAAILYEEGETAETSAAFRGGVAWRLENQGEDLPAIVGRVVVPRRNLSIDLTIKKNQDTSLSASHLIEMSFAAPPQAIGGGIQDVPTLVLKDSEEAQGDVLSAVSVKVSDSLFWIALSSAEQDITNNLQLLAERTWFDLPVRYVNNRRAIITLEKGREGEQVFAAALEAWSRSE